MDKIKSKSFYNIISQIVTLIVPLIIAPYISRVFFAKTLGEYTYAVSIVTYFTLIAGLGLNNYGVQRTTLYRDSKLELSKFFSEMILIRFIATGVSLVFFLIFIFVEKNNSTYYFILLLNIINVFFDITWFYQGLEDFKKIALRSVLVKIFLCIFTFLFVKDNSDIYLYAIIVSLTTLIPNVLLWPGIHKHVNFSLKNISLKTHIKYILGFFIPSIAVTIYTVLDKTMIGFISNLTEEVSYYEQAYKIMITTTSITNVLCPVFLPMMTKITDDSKIREIYIKTFEFTYFIAFIFLAGLLALSDKFVILYYGEQYVASIKILQLFAIMPFLVGIHNLIEYQYIYPNALVKSSTIIICCGALIDLLLNLPLICFLKAYGAAIATVITELVISLAYLYVLHKRFNIFIFFKNIWKYILAASVSYACMFLLKKIMLDNWLGLIFNIIIGVFTYILVLIIEREYYTNYFLHKIFRR